MYFSFCQSLMLMNFEHLYPTLQTSWPLGEPTIAVLFLSSLAPFCFCVLQGHICSYLGRDSDIILVFGCLAKHTPINQRRVFPVDLSLQPPKLDVDAVIDE